MLIAPAPTPELPPSDTKFLNKYAELRDIEAAAIAVGTTAALITSRRSHSKLLDAAMTKLEAELTIPKLVPDAGEYEWTDEKRARLIEVYVDSGNLAIARDAVKCTPSQLWRELDSNAAFAAQIDDARIRAAQVFEERAHAEALNGNDRLLPLVLKAERPDKYTDRMRVDVTTKTDQLTDEQLTERLSLALDSFFGRVGLRVVPARGMTIDAEPPASLPPPVDHTSEPESDSSTHPEEPLQ